MIVNNSKVLITIMWIKIKKILFPIHTWNNIFILIVYDETIFFCFFLSNFKLRIWWKNVTIFYLIICDIVKFIFPTKKINVLLIWQKIQFICFFPYLEKIMLIRLKINRTDMLLLFSSNNRLFVENFFITSNSPP